MQITQTWHSLKHYLSSFELIFRKPYFNKYNSYYQMTEATANFKIIIISLMIVAGAINTIASKFQNKQMVYQGPYFKYFFHPYMQATAMFLGEAVVLVIFLVMKNRDKEGVKMRMLQAKSKGKIVEFSIFLYAIPAVSDLITATLHYVALNFIAGSVYQMMRGGTIVTTFLFSMIFLKMKAKRNQKVGSALAFLGVLTVGIASLAYNKSSSSDSDAGMQIVGYILLIVSLITNGFQFVFQQKMLHRYHIQPLQMVGFQGIFGLAIELILLIIMSFVPCNFGIDACVISDQGLAFIESPATYFRQASQSGILMFFCILGIFSIATFNVTGVTVTKHINSLARSICDVTRTAIVWIVGIIVTVTAGVDKPNYKWELIDGGAIGFQLLGFTILILGNLIYNRIIKLPFLQPKQAQNPLMDQQEDTSQNEIGQSSKKQKSVLTQNS